MKLPEMIIFDYGGTLLCEPGFDARQIERVAFEHLTANPMGLSEEQIYAHVQELFRKVNGFRMHDAEVHQHQFMRLAYESLGLEFDIPYSELEELQWLAASPGAVMPHADTMLDYLNSAGIRTAVISNIGWSKEALCRRLDRLLPRNRFEFVIASCDYGIRKPDRLLFEVALKKAGLSADKVWYCGDNVYADVTGAGGAGIYPVHYRGEPEEPIRRSLMWDSEVGVDFDYLELEDWRHLPMVLEDLRARAADGQDS